MHRAKVKILYEQVLLTLLGTRGAGSGGNASDRYSDRFKLCRGGRYHG
jgi:hypothetical protein